MDELPVPGDWTPVSSVVSNGKQHRLFRSVIAVSFWIAVLLPMAYPILFIAGITTVTDIALFAGVVFFHVVTLVAGRQYYSDDGQ